ncbi:MAG: DUF1624 domain-containing protein [Burkholderiaceae bacterium]|nr:DUF1624 domain-containing protein [Burkholderiaceae bacterium]
MNRPARIESLDLFRGAAVALMVVVNNPGSWGHLYPPLAHAAWHGLTPTDLVFPFFLFAVGQALALALPGWLAAPASRFWRKWLARTTLIFALGLALNAAPFVRWDAAGQLVLRDWDTLRWLGVLQRIALAWAGAALLLMACRGRARVALAATAALLLGYWGLCLALGDSAEPYSLEGFFGTRLDRALLGAGHLYQGEGVAFDPEGLASTVPAVAQVLLGWWVGTQWRAAPAPRERMLARLLIAACALGALAWLWQLVLPINKKLWTPSYVLLSTALAIAGWACLAWVSDLRSAVPGPAGRALRALLLPFGRNALGIFVLSGLLPRLQGLLRWPDGLDAAGAPRWISPWAWAWREVFEPLAADARLGSLLQALALLALYWALAAWLDRRGWYWRV